MGILRALSTGQVPIRLPAKDGTPRNTVDQSSSSAAPKITNRGEKGAAKAKNSLALQPDLSVESQEVSIGPDSVIMQWNLNGHVRHITLANASEMGYLCVLC